MVLHRTLDFTRNHNTQIKIDQDQKEEPFHQLNFLKGLEMGF